MFSRLPHPFVSSTASQRDEILENVNDPLWQRFLLEAESHFQKAGSIGQPKAGQLFCHDGKLDEVMAMAVLAYVRDDTGYWHQVGDWLRSLLKIYESLKDEWEIRYRQLTIGRIPESAMSNPRQFIDTFTPAYWLEGGFMIMVLDLYDMLEAYKPNELTNDEKHHLEELLISFASRYIYHEESNKFSNRGLWANNGILAAALVHPNPKTADILLEQSWERYQIFRSTFFDDCLHGEGSTSYHVMSVEGVFYYALTASTVFKDRDCYEGRKPENPELQNLRYPDYVSIARAYYQTAIPGPTPMSSPRGAAFFKPVSINPAFLHAYSMSKCPELGWMIRQRASSINSKMPTPLKVSNYDILGLGLYEPLKSFWVYRPIEEVRPPRRRFHVFPDHGEVFSRSSWKPDATCVTARFGYEGSGKGHRDHGHVTLYHSGLKVLADPFPEGEIDGHDSSLFHNTVTLDNMEPRAVIGSISTPQSLFDADSFMILNRGGFIPPRNYLHDLREDANSWFCNQPHEPNHEYKRAVLHIHDQAVLIFDSVSRETSETQSPHIDWFFHSEFSPTLGTPDSVVQTEIYRLQKKKIIDSEQNLQRKFKISEKPVERGTSKEIQWKNSHHQATLRIYPQSRALQLSTSHDSLERKEWGKVRTEAYSSLRARQNGLNGSVLWVWDVTTPLIDVSTNTLEDGKFEVSIKRKSGSNLSWVVDFTENQTTLSVR
ncbi:heparinase II/III family protein [Puniceicoccus vermicola]|uniref:heparinase II/III family protein n=1 Tax=Puniceicoccus vermicola TaxID=388746 RepID=UPI00163A5164|nr:heparinase II/III family protein [Puniceicoccus vermicola]